MTSIRQKLFIQMGTLILLFVILLAFANTFLLEKYYVEKSKNMLIKHYETINTTNINDYTKDFFFKLGAESETKLDIIIVDVINNIAYTSENQLLGREDRQTISEDWKPPIRHLDILKLEEINEKTSFIWFEDPNIKTNFLMLSGALDSGLLIYLRISLTSVSLNVGLLNQFIILVGIVVFLIAMITAYFLSNHFTKPIVSIFETTNSIRKLDFSKKCQVITNDEIGRLGENINQMSHTIEDNINNLSRTNQQLHIEIQERIEIDEQRKALLSNVSHELKTPISLLQGYAEGIKLQIHQNREKTDFYCEVIIDEAKKMDMLVSQLLDINHIRFGDFPLYKEALNAKEYINYIIKKYEDIMLDKKLDFTTNLLIDDNLIIDVDPLRSEQILTNLLNNAVAYVDDSKKIFLKANKSLDGEHLTITIANAYPHIAENELERLWESFYKQDKARTRENGGYGLGLSIVKAIQDADKNGYGVYCKDSYINFYFDLDLIKY